MFHRPKTVLTQDGNEQGSTPVQAPVAARLENDTQTTQPSSAQRETSTMNQQTPNTDSPEASADPARNVDIPAANPFQRPNAPAANAARPAGPAAYGAAYPGAIYGAPGSSPSAGGETKGRRLVIGEGIALSGEIEACDHLIVEGTVEAALKGASILEISENGMFYGTVDINEATIAGRFEGDLTVNGRLTVRASGSITGAISYKELAVEAGATLDGKITPLSGGKGASSEKKSHKGKSDFSAKGVKKQDNAPQADESELPFFGRAAE